MRFLSTAKLSIFVLAISGSVFLVHIADNGLRSGWTHNVIRNWEGIGFFKLHGHLVYNPGGYEALSHPQIYEGHRAASLYPAFFFEHLFYPLGWPMAPYFVISISAVFFSIWHLLGWSRKAFWTAVVTILTPGFISWQTVLDPNLTCALAGFPFCAVTISLLRRPVLPGAWMAGFVGLLLVYSSLGWTTAFIHAMLFATLLVMRTVSWRKVVLYAVVAGLAATAIVAESLASKWGGTQGQPRSLVGLLQGYTWGDVGYGIALTTKTAVLRLVFVNLIGFLPLWLWLAWNFRSRSRRLTPGDLRFFLPLLVATCEVLFMRNYFGHHPWMSCHFFLLGLILSIGAWKEAGTTAAVPVPESHFPRGFFIPALALLSVFVYGFGVLMLFREHNADQFSLVKLIRTQTVRADSIIIATDRDPKLAGMADRLAEMFDRHTIIVTNLADWPMSSGSYLLSASATPDLDQTLNHSRSEASPESPWIKKMLAWYSRTIARRRPGDKLDLNDSYYLYQKTSRPDHGL